MSVWREDDVFTLEVVDHLHRVGRGADQVTHGLHFSRRIDVGQHLGAGVLIDEVPKLIGRATVCQRTPRVHVRDDDRFVGVQDLCSFGHEVNTAKGDHVAVRVLRRLRKGE